MRCKKSATHELVAIVVFLNLILFLLGCSVDGERVSSLPAASSPYILEYSPTRTMTPSMAQTVAPSPTFNPIAATQMAEFLIHWTAVAATIETRKAICIDGYRLELPESIDSLSNEKWMIFTCSPKPQDTSAPEAIDYGNRYTQVISTDFSQSWIISHRGFAWSDRPDALLSSYKWTQDGKNLYLIPATYPSGSGFYAPGFFLNDRVLYRLNLASGEFETMLPYSRQGYAFLLSPNDQHLAYAIPDEQKIIHVLKLDNNTKTQITLNGDYVLTGAFAWTSNSTKLVFASGLTGWENRESGISIFALTISNLNLQTIIYDDRRLLVPSPRWSGRILDYWTDNNMLYVTSLAYMSEAYFSDLLLNIETGEIVVAATPNPGLVVTATPKP